MKHVKPLSALLLCDFPPRVAQTVFQHIDAIASMPGIDVKVVSMLGNPPSGLDFSRFDIIIVHYSLVACNEHYLSKKTRSQLNASGALKAVFIQDEYRHINRTIEAFQEIGVDVLFTCMPDASIEDVYPEARLPNVRKVNVLTGYVDPGLLARAVKPLSARSVDVGYRARRVPAWLGDLGQEKWAIGQRFGVEAARYGLKCNISYREEERLYGEAWIQFLANCKATLGVESGSSVFDFSGEIQAAVDQAVAHNPSLTYQDLKSCYFSDVDNRINQRQISPRCFEAAALRTLMILYEGEYSGILEPWRHYVPLKKDHSNIGEIVSVIRDTSRAQLIADCAFQEIACSPKFQFSAHAASVSEILQLEHERRVRVRAVPYEADEFARARQRSRSDVRRLIVRKAISYGHYIFFGRLLGFVPESYRDKVSHYLKNQIEASKRLFLRVVSLRQ